RPGTRRSRSAGRIPCASTGVCVRPSLIRRRYARAHAGVNVTKGIQSPAMNTPRRINVQSGRQLEQVAHYSRALRVGDTVLQAGTTSLDRQGHVRGAGDAAAQVDAIMKIAAWSMGKAGGRLDDVVRNRMYV